MSDYCIIELSLRGACREIDDTFVVLDVLSYISNRLRHLNQSQNTDQKLNTQTPARSSFISQSF